MKFVLLENHSISDRLLNRFDGKYGEGAYDLLIRMFKDPLVSLTDVGLYFNFTKQRASVYFSNVFPGVDYVECFPRRRLSHRLRPKIDRYVPSVYLEGVGILEEWGFEPVLVSYKNTSRVVVNEFVVVCCRFYVSRNGKTAHLMFGKKRRSKDRVDFYLCVLRGIGGYLIPAEVFPDGGVSVPVSVDNASKYSRYLNNFGPLAG